MNLQTFLNTLNNQPENLQFTDTMAVIEALYDFAPTSFRNGNVDNAAGQNNGSCKLFAFAKLQGFNEQQTLNCFGAYYRDDVLQHPEANDHQNIRNFMQTGWAGVEFAGQALTEK
ncbi:MAG: HopJ type III effector protein [Oceanospirillaceae bacterium]|nr:HopJ type III effector protein [Oceanospirillaceae bacterium]MCP5350332.1 HopJ type III effector protein [Oceanospirillaceae bacterium]